MNTRMLVMARPVRLTNTVTFVQSIQPSDIDGSEGRDITLTLGEHTLRFKGWPPA